MASNKDITLQIRVPSDLVERIEEFRLRLANEGHGIQSRSEVVRRLLESGLEQGLAKPKRSK
jgi:metal-responsive CopG/Arc/MetJ family transcriptional regulator